MIVAKKLYWNSVLRLVIEAYFDILLGVGITYQVKTSATAKDMISSDVDLPGATLSEVSAIILLLVCVSMLPFILIFYLKNADRWED